MLAGLLPLLVLVGIVVLVVRLASGHDRTTAEGAGAAVRDVFQYLALLVTLVLSCVGLAGLFSEVVISSEQITRDTGAIAQSISFLVVGLPAFIALALYTRRRLRDDPTEVRSAGWAIYLTLVLFGSLVVTVAQSIALFGNVVAGEGIDWEVLVSVLISGTVWTAHSWIATHEEYAPDLSFERILGSFVGLVTMVAGGAISAVSVLVVIYDAVFDVTAAGSTTGRIVRPLVACAVGAAVWAWYWLRATLHAERSFVWIAYVLFAGVLSGVVMVAAGIGTAVFNVLDWLVADPSGTAATHFEIVPAALGVAAVGVANWIYHRSVLDGGPARARSDVDRFYDYLLAAVGLAVTAGGIATLITYAIWAVVGTEITGSDRSVIAVALTLLIVGAPLWGVYWARAQRARRRDGSDEVQATIRRIYVLLVLGIAGLVALVSLVVLVYLFVRAVLDGNVDAEMLDDMAVPIALLATTGAVAWYHFVVMRGDRAEAPTPVKVSVREVILITEDGAELSSVMKGADLRVRVFHAAAPAVDVASVDAVVATLSGETHEHVVVVDHGADGRFEVIPLR